MAIYPDNSSYLRNRLTELSGIRENPINVHALLYFLWLRSLPDGDAVPSSFPRTSTLASPTHEQKALDAFLTTLYDRAVSKLSQLGHDPKNHDLLASLIDSAMDLLLEQSQHRRGHIPRYPSR